MILKLPNLNESSDEESDSDEVASQKKKNQSNSAKFVEVEIDLALSAYANACKLYTNKKVAKVKEEKTAQASEKAIEAVEKQTTKQLEAQRLKRNLQAVRKVHWFEKFNWFITSEGYLVLSGRDAQQNEQLVKKYLRQGDAYVHADMHGASSCIVRAKLDQDSKPLPISPFALQEAGTMTICRSGAWTVKVVMSAWWVHAFQVSKSAPTGEYLTTGSFMIYGRKNFLPPTTLEMGFGVMFRLDDSSVARHLTDRKDKLVEYADDSSTMSMISDLSERYNIDMTPSAPADLSEPNITSGSEGRKAARANRKAQKGAKNQEVKIQDNMPGGEQSESPETHEQIEQETQVVIEGSTPKVKKTSQQKAKDSNQTPKEIQSAPPVIPETDPGFKKKKAPNKKKARRSLMLYFLTSHRYANQDEEDLEIAMQALGHRRPGGGGATLNEQIREVDEQKKSKEKELKQEKVDGIRVF